VIGSGVTGMSIALHLARRRQRVIVLEAHQIATGATGKSAGGIRLQFSDELKIRVSVVRFRPRPPYKTVDSARGSGFSTLGFSGNHTQPTLVPLCPRGEAL